ncbi:MAG: hypothetical protein AVDCRST_MAG27-80, partial [uncultured Craurococcus sp.]
CSSWPGPTLSWRIGRGCWPLPIACSARRARPRRWCRKPGSAG